MLAQNFKTPADLRLTDAEFEALVKLLGMLERGEINRVAMPDYTRDRSIPKRVQPAGFNMRQFYAGTECGTICCMGGWAEVVGKLKRYSLVNKRLNPLYMNLDDLFDPSKFGYALDPITTEQAAMALRNYLTFGEPRWDEALAE